jgi:hypothetical protein
VIDDGLFVHDGSPPTLPRSLQEQAGSIRISDPGLLARVEIEAFERVKRFSPMTTGGSPIPGESDRRRR